MDVRPRRRDRRRPFSVDLLESRTLLNGSSDFVGGPYSVLADPRATVSLDLGWKFIRSDVSGAQVPTFNDNSWSGVSVPHTWNAIDGEDGGSNYYRGVGWYRKTVTVPSSMVGDTIHVHFEGSSIVTALYVDGTLIGSHSGAFGAFDFDLTNALSGGGTHVFAVKVDNSDISGFVAPQSGDFTFFGGIYRDVSLLGVAPQHVSVDDYASSGVYFSSPSVSSTSASISVRTGLTNGATTARNVVVHSVLVDASGTIVADTSTPQTLAAGANASVTQSAVVANPHLWNGRLDPYLHDLYVEVRDASTNALVDLIHQRVGIRSYAITPTQGFLLNGVPYNLHGASLHQDRQDEGWAISDNDIRQDVGFFIEMGATVLRTAHYEQNQLLYDLCDAAGIVVYTEVPDVGSSNGGQIPTSAAFLSNIQQQLRELIRQNFNHPSIIVWGVYNEVSNTTDNRNFVANLGTLAHAEDPTRLTAGASNTYLLTDLERSTDVVGFNRYYGWYYGAPSDLAGQLDYLHAQSPAIDVGLTEYGAGASIYQHQDNPSVPQYDGPFHPEEYQDIFHEQSYAVIKARPWIWASFVWNMFDFAVDSRNEGDTAGRNDKGLVTYDRKTKKDAFYFYKANWSSDPVLYITSRRFTERTVSSTKVKIYANVDNPMLLVNGVSVGALVNSGNDVWTSPTINLAPGNNVISVSGTRNGVAVTDSVTWHYSTTTPTDPNVHINFQPAGGTTPANYAVDSGLPFGTRTNGAQYGWNADIEANTRRRNVNSDPRLDTLIHMQLGGTFTWEYALANGTYDVTIGAGDPSFTDSVNNLNVEGKTVLDPDGQDNFDTLSVRVTVNDGRLTISPAASGVNAKLDYVDIVPVTTGPTPGLPSAPTFLATLAQTTTAIALAWTDNADNETGFLIEQQNADGTYTQIGTTSADVTTYTVMGLQAGTAYAFRVRATNAVGQSDYSNILITSTQQGAASVPAMPTGLVATATGPTIVSLTWVDNATNETGYRVERQLAAGGAWAVVDNTLLANSVQYTDTTAVAGTAYNYQVFATNSVGDSPASNPASVTTPASPAPGPTAPTALTFVTSTTTTITFGWTDNSADEAAFLVEQKNSDGTFTQIGSTGANVSTFTAINLQLGTSYVFRVRAQNASGLSNYTNPLAATTSTMQPLSPSGLTAVAQSMTSVALSWADNSTNESGFRIERRLGTTGAWAIVGGVGANLMTFTDIAASANTTYNYQVTATASFGDSYASNIAVVTTPATAIPVPSAPTALTSTATTTNTITLAWADNSDNETGFSIEQQNGDGTFSQIGTTGANVATFTATGLQSGTSYVFRVRATNGTGYSGYSNTLTAATVTTIPLAATNLAAVALAANSVKLTWTDNATNEAGYRIERRLGTTGTWAVIDTIGANAVIYTDITAAANTNYNYQVFATNAAGSSPASNAATVTTPDANSYLSVDIGSPVTTGTTTVVTPNKEYDITAGGTDIWSTSDQFRFVYKSITGDFDYSARIIGLTATDPGSMAGLMARETLAANSRHIYMRARAMNDLRANYRITTGGTSVGLGTQAITFPNAYVRLQRVGNVFTAYGSADGITWTIATQQTIAMNATIFLGMAVNAHVTTAATTTAKIRDLTDRNAVTVTVPAAPTGLVATPDAVAPTVTLTWLDNATNEAGYRVERRLSTSSTWTPIVSLGANAVRFVDTPVSFNTSYVYRVFATNAAGDSLPTAEASVIVTNAPPTVVISVFTFDTGHAFTIQFNEAMDASTITASDLVVSSLDTPGLTFTPSSVTYDATTNRATFVFATPLPDGNYTASLSAGSVSDATGVALAGNFTSAVFFTLAGDVNHDRVVNFNDLVIISQNYHQSGQTYSQGNLDYSADGNVNFSDLVIVAQNYGRSLLPPTS